MLWLSPGSEDNQSIRWESWQKLLPCIHVHVCKWGDNYSHVGALYRNTCILVNGNSPLASIGNVSVNATCSCELIKNADVSTSILQPSSFALMKRLQYTCSSRNTSILYEFAIIRCIWGYITNNEYMYYYLKFSHILIFFWLIIINL